MPSRNGKRGSSRAEHRRKRTSGTMEALESRLLLSAAPVLLRDPSNAALFTTVGANTYFEESAGALYVTNGTPGSTIFIHAFATIRNMTPAGGKLYVTADDGVWSSDGTPAGTKLILPMFNNIDGIGVGSGYTEFNGNVYFFASVRNVGVGLWKTDGTAAGTSLVESIGSAQGLTVVGGTLFFIGDDDSTYGRELWKSDGTEAGTVRVTDLNPGSGDSIAQLNADPIASINGKLLFVASDANLNSVGLWTSDGTATGTVRLTDSSVRVVGDLTASNGDIYFSAVDGSEAALWKTDGTPANTVLVKELGSAGTILDAPAMLTDVNNALDFTTPDSTTGSELWRSDGTSAGTQIIDGIHTQSGWHQLSNLTNVGGTLAFTVQDNRISPATFSLWVTRGDAASTTQIADTFTTSSQYIPGKVGAAGTIALFTSADASGGSELSAYQTALIPPVPQAVARGPAPYIVDEGGSLTLHGFTTAVPLPDRPLTYEWDLDGDGIFGETGANAARGDEIGTDPTFNAAGLDGPSTQPADFRISDATGYTSTDSANIAIQNVPPTLNATGSPSTLVEGNPYTLNLSASDPGPDTISQWVVNWGDGQVQTFAGDTSSVDHLYPPGYGTYGILVQASDEDGTYTFARSAAFDPQFGTEGKVLSQEGTTEDSPVDLVVQPDGKIVTLSDVQSDSLFNDDHTLISRYNADGSLDSTFGNQGRVLFNQNRYGIGEGPIAIALQPDGRIVVTGEFHDSLYPYQSGASTFLLRLLPDGSFDPSFGQGGWASYTLGINPALGQLIIQPDGHILGGGIENQQILLARFNSDGSLDDGFGNAGVILTGLQGNAAGVREMIQQPDGKILVLPILYAPSGNFTILRFNSDGSPDPTFGNAGGATVGSEFGAQTATSMTLAPDGSILVAGQATRPPLSPVQPGGTDAIVLRLTSSGQLDTTFGDDGVLRTLPAGPFNSSIPPDGMFAPIVRLLPGGRFLLAGRAWSRSSPMSI